MGMVLGESLKMAAKLGTVMAHPGCLKTTQQDLLARITKVQHGHNKPKKTAAPKRLSWADKYWIPSLMGKEYLSKRDSSIRNGQVPLPVVKWYQSLVEIWTYLLRHFNLIDLKSPILDDDLQPSVLG